MQEEYDFSHATRGAVLPQPGKTQITLWVDTDVYEAYLAYAEQLCRDITPEMNIALRQYIEALTAQPVARGKLPTGS